MSKILLLSGCFMIGVAIVGTVSYSASIISSLRPWAFSLLIIKFLVFITIIICDDFIIQYWEIPREKFISLIIGSFLTFLIGGLIQWQ
ncbi:MAG: hypothetical protein J7647_22300 [Cyanobacteria bacterium SBLK]|nr:hypothetical protein [Cyanobacteria bacterium SBLK]